MTASLENVVLYMEKRLIYFYNYKKKKKYGVGGDCIDSNAYYFQQSLHTYTTTNRYISCNQVWHPVWMINMSRTGNAREYRELQPETFTKKPSLLVKTSQANRSNYYQIYLPVNK